MFSRDSRQTNAPQFQGTKTNYDSYQLGISKLTSFGLKASLSYNVGYTNIIGATILPVTSFYDAKPLLEFTQSLWRNGFGGETVAQVDLVNAQVLATGYGESFKARGIVSEAEMAYWQLSLARARVVVQEQTLERAKKILDWAKRRVNNDLADKADLLQAEAAYEQRTLDLQQAEDDEESAARKFNSMMEIDSDEVTVQVEKLDPAKVQALGIPKRAEMRDDVKAAQQMERVAVANTELVRQRISPSLDIIGSVALNARNANLNSGFSESFSTRHPLTQIGVKFNVPLDFGLVSEARQSALVERQGATLSYQRKLFEQEREWKDTTRKFAQAKKRLELAHSIEDLQHEKITHEKSRLDRGRTTTYQVILMEQDYSLARLAKLMATTEVLSIYSRLKTFGGEL
jgi:outer membrane protein TolC